ncbi:hypothetical protein PFLUV_G00237830 [Perca fluviatilis]|uniref:Immunoglobulin V-set domain-containing protein n=1 Tax=Perca fluviatilis TaxID=8168 RepID=A0A6A5E416_PERFL|nr:hypothetical protein PFLUV_G00237830 [Perca fluviatilis]
MKAVIVFCVFVAGVALVILVHELPTLSTRFLLAGVLIAGLVTYLSNFTITVSKVEVEEGARDVKLPATTFIPPNEDFTVEWSRCAPEPMTVHEYVNGNDHLATQDRFYSNRTKLEKDPLMNRDFSLTLKDPCFRDSGTYICTVYKTREVHTQQVVRLRVKEKRWSLF